MSEWKGKALNYVCKDVVTGGTPLSSVKEYFENGEIPWLKTKEVNFNRIKYTENYISLEGLANSSAKLIPINSVIVAMYGQGDTAGRVAINKIPLSTNQACCNLIIDEKKADYNFIYYSLSNSYEELVLRKTGSAQPNLNTRILKDFPILLPSLPEQTAIASVLSSLDDKIDLLHRQNTTLEKMAETLFRQWFVEDAKEEWEVGKITDYAIHYKDSIHPQQNQAALYSHYSIPAFDNGKNPINELGQEIQSNKYKVPKNCILFSKLNPHKDKRLWLLQNEVGKNSICSTEFLIVLPKRKEYLYFLYEWLSLKENYNEIASGVGGTSGSHQRIAPNTIYDFQCPLVAKSLIENFNTQIEPLFQKQLSNQTQIHTLTALRDTLLPKLMNGEVTIKM
ncbi:MAG: restriction endonuclease subunit S [Porphyromonadaceae bacterium]|nr:restriction endonuclease subunit S [Porphyromonadaceae bacterium]